MEYVNDLSPLRSYHNHPLLYFPKIWILKTIHSYFPNLILKIFVSSYSHKYPESKINADKIS